MDTNLKKIVISMEFWGDKDFCNKCPCLRMDYGSFDTMPEFTIRCIRNNGLIYKYGFGKVLIEKLSSDQFSIKIKRPLECINDCKET